ncbi:hypothetical protein ACFOWX_09285 [Sphingorhabdus arenilitoris]|uniref:Uncharacterized protein n=1 Tax=Sphingorhabdus arenilitoris TaxID=1490041 RepID=A0ABV8RGV6_9SPHN
MTRDYSSVMNAAAALEAFSGFLTFEDKKEMLQAKGAFKAARNAFVYEALSAGENSEKLKEEVVAELAQMEALQPGYASTCGFVRDELCQRIDQEGKKSPLLRRTIKWTPAVLGLTAFLAYISWGILGQVEITQSIDTAVGIQQRAAAFERAVDYDRAIRNPFGGTSAIREMIAWPIKPSETELVGAGEFVSLALSGYEKLSQEKQVCGDIFATRTDTLSKQDIDLVQRVAEYVNQEDVKWQSPPVMTILEPIRQAFPCA